MNSKPVWPVFSTKRAALVFSTGYQTNFGILATLIGKKDYLYLDKLDHASAVDGSQLAHGTVLRYPHGDLETLEQQLQKTPPKAGKLIVTDGIFSMEGDIADLPSLVALAEQYQAEIMVDDAHSFGVLGKNGGGDGAAFWCRGPGRSDYVVILQVSGRDWRCGGRSGAGYSLPETPCPLFDLQRQYAAAVGGHGVSRPTDY